MEDQEGFNKNNRENVAKSQANIKKVDLEGFNENNKERVGRFRAKKMEEDPAELKREQQMWKAKQRINTGNTYLKEVRLAAIFPCVCCHTLNFRQQVVEFSQKQAELIKEKAFAAHQKREVIVTTSSKKSSKYLTVNFHEIFYMADIPNKKYLTMILHEIFLHSFSILENNN